MEPDTCPPDDIYIVGETDDGESDAIDDDIDLSDPAVVGQLEELQARYDEIAAIEDDDERLEAAKQLHIELAGGEEAGRA